MITLLYNGLKRLVFGSTSVFAVRSGSVPLIGSSFASVYSERTQYPLRIVGIKFTVDPSSQSEWRITVDSERIFPYNEVNPMDSEYHSLMSIEIAAGERFDVEVRSRNKEYRGIAILEELDIMEMK